MRIGELGQATGVDIETIRYYEKAELLPPPARAPNGYRAYTPAHLERLAFIRHCRSLDMTLEEIRALLRFREMPDENCGEVNELLDRHIEHVANRIAELRDTEVNENLLIGIVSLPWMGSLKGVLIQQDWPRFPVTHEQRRIDAQAPANGLKPAYFVFCGQACPVEAGSFGSEKRLARARQRHALFHRLDYHQTP